MPQPGNAADLIAMRVSAHSSGSLTAATVRGFARWESDRPRDNHVARVDNGPGDRSGLGSSSKRTGCPHPQRAVGLAAQCVLPAATQPLLLLLLLGAVPVTVGLIAAGCRGPRITSALATAFSFEERPGASLAPGQFRSVL